MVTLALCTGEAGLYTYCVPGPVVDAEKSGFRSKSEKTKKPTSQGRRSEGRRKTTEHGTHAQGPPGQSHQTPALGQLLSVPTHSCPPPERRGEESQGREAPKEEVKSEEYL